MAQNLSHQSEMLGLSELHFTCLTAELISNGGGDSRTRRLPQKSAPAAPRPQTPCRLQSHRSRLVPDYVDTEGGDIQLGWSFCRPSTRTQSGRIPMGAL